jgi:hypothetical protein
MYQWELFIDGYYVETFEHEDVLKGPVEAGKRAKFLMKERNKSAKKQYVLSDISLDYKGFKPKPAQEVVVSTLPPEISDYRS